MGNASTVMAVVYFTLNIVLLIALAAYVKKTQTHKKIASASFFKAIWSQRKIFGPLLVYFYDTATDIGVIIFYYELAHDGNEYTAVKPLSYFWLSLSFLIIYRVAMILFTIFAPIMMSSHKKFKDSYAFYDPLLVLFDVYIFKTVYLSFKEAKHVATSTNTDDHIERQTSDKSEKSDDAEVKQHDTLFLLLYIEALTESFFETILQSMFILRSGSDPLLINSAGSMTMAVMSLLGSFASVSNKWSQLDQSRVIEKAQSLKPKKEFPHCVAYWYLIRYIWRMSDFGSSFIIMLLLVTVSQSVWFIIWAVGSYMMFAAVLIWKRICCKYKNPAYKLFGWILWGDLEAESIIMSLKHLSHSIAMVLIFTVNKGDKYDPDNKRYLVFYIIGIVLLLINIALYYIMKLNHILIIRNTVADDKKSNAQNNGDIQE